MRLDLYLVKNNLCETRNKAKACILAKQIQINDKIVDKPNYEVKENDQVTKLAVDEYVSRGAYKLLKAIDTWLIDFSSKVILDIGSSTGGFSDVAIKQRAKFVYAIDVGTEQLHHSLRKLENLKVYENTNFKDLIPSMLEHKIDFVVADVSFISLTILIDKLVTLLPYKHSAIFLIKPEFELSPAEVSSKKGLVVSPALRKKAINKISNYAMSHQYKVLGVCESPIKGNKMGNVEYLIYLEHS